MSDLGQSTELLIHVIDVDHGDAMILEFPSPDETETARLAVVDAGRPEKLYRKRFISYLTTLLALRGRLESGNFRIEFVCVTHPHEDHYGGLRDLLDNPLLEARIHQYWDCGFRTNAVAYNKLLKRISESSYIVYDRLASGFECELDGVRIDALAPSLDLRNRFDTYGVDRNNGSIVLKVRYGASTAILAGDAFLDSWAKVVEEFPRRRKILYARDASPERSEGANQLNCQLLKISHHGSKHGTSLEFLEKLTPSHVMITCANRPWYRQNEPNWGDQWPHPLVRDILRELPSIQETRCSAKHGNVVYHLTGRRRKPILSRAFHATACERGFRTSLKRALRPA